MVDYNECKYWFECKQDKRILCTTNPEKCIIYMKFDTLAKNNPKARTGLERFIDRYGENWREVAFGEFSYIPTVKSEIIEGTREWIE